MIQVALMFAYHVPKVQNRLDDGCFRGGCSIRLGKGHVDKRSRLVVFSCLANHGGEGLDIRVG